MPASRIGFLTVRANALANERASLRPLMAICDISSGTRLKYGVPTATKSSCASVPACPSQSVITGRPIKIALGRTDVSMDTARRSGAILRSPDITQSTAVAAA